MNVRNIFTGILITLFLGGGYWYYSHAPQRVPRADFPFVSPTSSVGGGTFQLPTSVPHVTGPTTPPPTKTLPPKPIVLSSGIRGSVFMGPICPVQRDPPDPQCADKPYEAKLVVKDGNGTTIKTFSSNSAGMFEVSLPAGAYSVGPAPSTAFLPRAGFQDVVVKTNSFTSITIQFDSGIR